MARPLVIAALFAALAVPPRAASARVKPRAVEPAKGSDKGADGAFAEAKSAYHALRKDEKRRKFRDQWLAVGQKFEQVAERFPKSPRAADALFDAADLYAELSRVSLARRDLKAAIDAYGRLCERYPSSNLADDAHLALGRVFRDRRGDTEMARAEFKAALACKGDQQAKARQALASLGPPRADAKEAAPSSQKEVGPEKADNKAARPGSAPEPAAVRAEQPEHGEAKGSPAAMAMATGTGDDAEDDDEETAPPAPAALDPARVRALKAAAKAGVPLSVQVGLKVRRVIIDPGHGGVDTGAIGPGGAREKDAVLAIALVLKEELAERGLPALLTRETDKFVSLEDRARFANRNKGDLFVSVHCNAHKSSALSGVETYTLNVTSDAYAIRLAARENAASERKVSDLQFILADLATRANTDDSTRLARSVQASLVAAESEPKRRAVDLGVKQALFYVLLGARMPSVLVETAFISNPSDEKRLRDPKRQKAIARAIADGIGRYTSDRDLYAKALTD